METLKNTKGRIVHYSRNILLVIFMFITVLDTAGAIFDGTQGTPADRHMTIQSTILGESRDVYVALPAGYADSTSSYPVLFTLFNGKDGFAHSSGVVRQLYTDNKAPQMILISVTVDGMKDLTPTRTPSYGPTSGGAGLFIRFLKEELVPFVEEEFRAAPHRIYWSHSIGGTLGIYAFLSEPGLFYAVLTSSPFFIYDREDRFLLKNAERLLKGRPGILRNYLYITVGDEPPLKKELDEFDRILREADPPGLERDYTQMRSESHSSIQSKSLKEGLERLFSKRERIPGSWIR